MSTIPSPEDAEGMPVQTIGIADDEDDLRETVAEYLTRRGFRVVQAADAAGFRELCAQEHLDLAILDIRMPHEDGLSLARWLRERSAIGIIFATAADEPIDRVVGLEIGADDYLTKPYEMRELLARVRCILRRTASAAPVAAERAAKPVEVIAFQGFQADLSARRLVDPSGRTVDLTAGEFDLLAVLAQRPRRTLSREQISTLLDLGGIEVGRGIDIRIARLRKKIEDRPDAPRLLRTVHGQGYVFTPEG
ncbi:response regulator [Mongoliimonas terrestris]|uniref:response regulator n=1 Tax=Mongoliimonas terrestris TaxID=1709001 RepID=UPI000AD58DD5|nr:response regulator transcription factor [Mongoliimonas terrestris]